MFFLKILTAAFSGNSGIFKLGKASSTHLNYQRKKYNFNLQPICCTMYNGKLDNTFTVLKVSVDKRLFLHMINYFTPRGCLRSRKPVPLYNHWWVEGVGGQENR